MKPLPWIRLLAHPVRTAVEPPATGQSPARRMAATGRNLAVLRASLAHAIERQLAIRAAGDGFDCTCTNDQSAYGFSVRVPIGPSAGHRLWVDHCNGVVTCGFHSDMPGCGCVAHTASMQFARSGVVLVESQDGSIRRFASMDAVATHLLNVVIAHR